MAILTKEEIIKRINTKELIIEPFILENLDAASLDVQMGNTLRVFKKNLPASLEITEDINFDEVSDVIKLKDRETYVLHPGEIVHTVTKEYISLPQNICVWIEGRSRFARVGLVVHMTAPFIQPGSSGNQVLEMINLGSVPLIIKPGIKIAQLIFEECKGNASYTGRFQKQKTP